AARVGQAGPPGKGSAEQPGFLRHLPSREHWQPGSEDWRKVDVGTLHEADSEAWRTRAAAVGVDWACAAVSPRGQEKERTAASSGSRGKRGYPRLHQDRVPVRARSPSGALPGLLCHLAARLWHGQKTRTEKAALDGPSRGRGSERRNPEAAQDALRTLRPLWRGRRFQGITLRRRQQGRRGVCL